MRGVVTIPCVRNPDPNKKNEDSAKITMFEVDYERVLCVIKVPTVGTICTCDVNTFCRSLDEIPASVEKWVKDAVLLKEPNLGDLGKKICTQPQVPFSS